MTGTTKPKLSHAGMGLFPSSMEPVVMGILNCTPDSFVEGSRQQTADAIARRADRIIAEGGGIIDIGACSTRPGGKPVSEAEELMRMRQALEAVRQRHPEALISIDTFRPVVARMAVEEYGADLINDVSEGGMASSDGCTASSRSGMARGMFREAARLGVPYVLMSRQKDMEAMLEAFRTEVEELRSMGVRDIILDPGYGFGKDAVEGNYAVLREQWRLREAFPDMPILAGVSRKRMICILLGCSPDSEAALHGTMLANLVALQGGASILRVHDVGEAVNTIEIYKKTRNR